MSNLNNDISLEQLLNFVDNEGASAPHSSEIDDKKVFGEDPIYNDQEDDLDTTDDLDGNTDDDTLVDDGDNLNKDTPEITNTPITSTATDDAEPVDSSSTYQEYYNILNEKGLVFTDDDFKFDGTVESLSEALEQTSNNLQKSVFTAFWERLPEEWKPALQYALNGGTDVKKYLETFKSFELDNLDVRGSSEDQRTVLQEYYKATTKYSPEKIDKLIDRLQVMGDIEEEAESALVELKEIEQEKRKELATQQELETKSMEEYARKKREVISTTIDSNDTIAQNRKPKVKAFIFNLLQNNGDESPETQFNRTLKQIEANEAHFVQLADFLMDSYDPKKGFTFDRFIKKGATTSNQTIKEKLEAINNKTNIKGSASKLSNKDIDWEAFLMQN